MTLDEINIRLNQLHRIANDLKGIGNDDISHCAEKVLYEAKIMANIIADEDYEGVRLGHIEEQLASVLGGIELILKAVEKPTQTEH